MKINREDMLELTRRMTPKRKCFSRIAGAYFDRGVDVNGIMVYQADEKCPHDELVQEILFG